MGGGSLLYCAVPSNRAAAVLLSRLYRVHTHTHCSAFSVGSNSFRQKMVCLQMQHRNEFYLLATHTDTQTLRVASPPSRGPFTGRLARVGPRCRHFKDSLASFVQMNPSPGSRDRRVAAAAWEEDAPVGWACARRRARSTRHLVTANGP